MSNLWSDPNKIRFNYSSNDKWFVVKKGLLLHLKIPKNRNWPPPIRIRLDIFHNNIRINLRVTNLAFRRFFSFSRMHKIYVSRSVLIKNIYVDNWFNSHNWFKSILNYKHASIINVFIKQSETYTSRIYNKYMNYTHRSVLYRFKCTCV